MTPAEIIYQRRIAVLDHAQRTGNVAEACRVFGISRTRYYEWKNRGRPLRARGADAQGAPGAPDARGHPHPRHRGPVDPGRDSSRPSAVASTPIGSATRASPSPSRRCKSTWSPTGWASGRSAWPGRRPLRRRRRGCVTEAARKDEPFGFCLATGGPGELVCLDSFYIGKLKGVGKVYQLTAIDVFTRWAFVAIVLGTAQRRHDGPLHRPGAAPLSASRGQGPGGARATTAPSTSPATFVAALAAKGLASRAHPGPLAQPQRRVRALPRHHPPRVLAPGLPPPSLHLDPPAPGRSRRLAHHLQPPPAQPRRLHARTHPS